MKLERGNSIADVTKILIQGRKLLTRNNNNNFEIDQSFLFEKRLLKDNKTG